MEKKDTNRFPVDVPMECYGVAQKEGREMCAACQFKRGCAEFMGSRVGRIPMSAVQYNLKTTRLQAPDRIVLAYTAIETSYATAHRLVFNTTSKSMKIPQADADGIRKAAEEAHCTVLELCLTLMGLWKKTHPETQFRPRFLLSAYSAKVMHEARRVAIKNYAGFCGRSVADLVGIDVVALKEKLLAAEITFGSHVVGALCKKPVPVETLLRNTEFSLDATWLALEDAYGSILSNSDKEDLSPMLKNHRHDAARARCELAKDERVRHAAYRTRSEIMPAATVAVLEKHGLTPVELEVEDKPVTNAVKHWKGIATAVKHVNAHRIYSSF